MLIPYKCDFYLFSGAWRPSARLPLLLPQMDAAKRQRPVEVMARQIAKRRAVARRILRRLMPDGRFNTETSHAEADTSRVVLGKGQMSK